MLPTPLLRPTFQEDFGHEGAKPQKAVYLRDGLIFTTGFSRMSERQYALRVEVGTLPGLCGPNSICRHAAKRCFVDFGFPDVPLDEVTECGGSRGAY